MTCTACPEAGPLCALCQAATPGAVIDGRYRVERPLGAGARKRVVLATDTWLERPVAVWLLRDGHDPEAILALRREATLTARLSASERVVAVYDVGETGGLPYLIAQYLPGGSLQESMATGALAPQQALAIARDVALALADVHALGLVHRDVKPGNIWLTADGRAVLGDFGLAVAEGAPVPPEQDRLSGTAAYLPPEQLSGHAPGRRGDLYALGVVLWEMLCGRPLFAASDTPAVLGLHLRATPEPPSRHAPGLPAAVDGLVLQLLAKSPDHRPDSARRVAEQLAALRTATLAARPSTVGSTAFVGRHAERRELSDHLAEATAGHGSLALLLGEAGMGKTRLAGELDREARSAGVLVLAGRCHEGEGAPAFWLWTQILRAAQEAFGADELRRLAGPSTRLLGALLPELAEDSDDVLRLDTEGARFRLFDAVSRLLHEITKRVPVLAVLDDVHWADVPTVALTRYVARELSGRRLALLACARELTSPDPALAAALGGLAATASRSIELVGLPMDQAARFVEQLAGVRPSEGLMHTLHGRTDGNPFFLAELVRLLATEHRLSDEGTLLPGAGAVPSRVREVLHRRLEHVSPACSRVLSVAAVIGRDVPFDVLCAVTQLPAKELLARLDEAVAARLIAPVPGVPVTHRFSHALVQEALHESLPTGERVELHRAVAEALADLRRNELDERAAELAHHFVQAVPGGDPAEAIRWSVRAAHQALAAAAYEEAVAHYTRALALAESTPSGTQPRPQLGNLLLSLGDAQCRAGLTDACRVTFQRAADLALAENDAGLLAYAVLGYGTGLGGFGFVEHADGVLLSLIEEALAALDPSDSPLRVRLLARLATELYFTPFRSRRLQVSEEALSMARRLGDPAGELLALYSRTWAMHGPDGLEERRTTADQIVRLARRLGDDEMAFRGCHLRLNILLEVGQWEQVEADVDSCRRLAASLAQPVHRWQVAVFDAMRVLLTGRPDEAEAAAGEALALGRRGYSDMAAVEYGAQLLTVRWAQGRLEEVLEAVRAFADRYPHAPAWRAALAFCYSETGRLDAARAELETLASRDFRDLPEDGNFLTAASLLAFVAARLGDLPRARLLRDRLAPYAERSVVIAAGAVAFVSVSLPLAALATALGEPDAALRHLERARERHAARRAGPLLVWTGELETTALLAGGTPESCAAALEVAKRTVALARELGMPRHVERLLAMVPEAAFVEAGAGRPVTVVLTDVAGSTAMTERIGELAMHALLTEHRQAAERMAKLHGGTALKSLGDGVLLAFPDAAAALRCAAALRGEAGSAGLALRLGVHTGPVLREGDSMYGRTMILAFRVADRALAGEVLVSAATRDAVRDVPGMRFDRGRRLRLKGFSEAQRVHRLLPAELPRAAAD